MPISINQSINQSINFYSSPDLNLVENMEGQTELASGVLELDSVTPDLESILQDETWVHDATYDFIFFNISIAFW
jgi:hypothetical protein